jgi:hypothetical protein
MFFYYTRSDYILQQFMHLYEKTVIFKGVGKTVEETWGKLGWSSQGGYEWKVKGYRVEMSERIYMHGDSP